MTAREAVEILHRAAEGGAFENVGDYEVARRAEELLGSELPEGVVLVNGWAEAKKRGLKLFGRLAARTFLARAR